MAITLVPSQFFVPAAAREALAAVAELSDADEVRTIDVPQHAAVLIYTVSGGEEDSLPEIFHLIESLQTLQEYNKVAASYDGSVLSLAVAQGRSLLIASEFPAIDFTTAQYYIFAVLKSLQLNPEVSTISFRSKLNVEEEMSLCRYFKSVERI